MISDVSSVVLESVLRWTVPFALAWLIVRGINFSAAARHLIWAMLLAGLLLLPLVAAVLPAYRIPQPILPEPLGSAAGVVRVNSAAGPSVGYPGAEEGEGVRAAARSSDATQPTYGQDRAESPDRGDPLSGLRANWSWIWLGGALGLLGFWVVGQFSVRSLAGRSSAAPDPQVALLQACAWRMGVRREVRLLHSDQNLVPMTWGWARPVVLLPADSVSWSEEQLRRVLLHELAHVARFDSPIRSLARITCSAFWFHPAVWYAAHLLHREAEMACDDRVVEVEGAPFAYAEDLLRIAHGWGTAPFPAQVLPLARRSGLNQRIRALLETRRRRGISRRLAGAVALGVFALICTVAAIRWTDPVEHGEERPEDWLIGTALEDGRRVWTLDCGSTADGICLDGARRAAALLERTGRTGAVIAQRVSTGEVVMYTAVRRPGSERSDAMPHVAPGSVAKLALAALWWESGWADSLAACPVEIPLPSGRPLRNAGGYASGPVSAERMLVVSCNTAAVAIAARLIERQGAPGFARDLERMGLAASERGSVEGAGRHRVALTGITPRTPVAGAGPAGAIAEADDLLLLAGLGIDGGTTTPLQVSQFLQTIGNGGRRLPAVPVGHQDPRSEPIPVVREDAALRLQRAMLQVVREGTAARTLPQLEWSRWTLGGKTGTVPGSTGDPDGWFAGLAYGPDGRAEYTIVVLVEGGGVGGGAPAGIAAEMTRLFARIRGDEL